MTTRLSIRPLQPSEHSSAAYLLATSEPWAQFGLTEEAAVLRFTDSQYETIAAFDGDTLLGMVMLTMQGALVGYIKAICVGEAARGRGVGALLMDAAEERILSESPNVFLCVSSFNTGAQRFYRSRGYQQVGEIPDYVVEGASELLMRKTRGPMIGAEGYR